MTDVPETLLPCPFCGGNAERVDIEDGENAGGSFIHCTRCEASSNIEFGFKENFVSNWNRRAAQAERMARLEEAMKPFAKCADELDGNDDIPRAPDGEWAKFRLLTDDYRRARRALSQEVSDA